MKEPNPREILIDVFERLLPVMQEFDLEEFNDDEEADDSEIRPDELADFLLEPPAAYTIPHGAVLTFLLDLTLPHTTVQQWWIGRYLANQMYWDLMKKINPRRGPRSKFADRVLLCLHVEWIYQQLELDQLEDAVSITAHRFKASESTLRNWYFGGKGKAQLERNMGRSYLEFFEQLREIVPTLEVEQLLPAHILDDIQSLKN